MKLKYFFLTLLTISNIFLAAIFFIGSILSSPSPSKIGAMSIALKGKNVNFISKTGRPLSGWFVRGKKDRGGVLLMHGVRSNRTEMIGRAIFLNQSGYSVLLFDFQAHGESPGEHITFGYLEAQDAEAAFSYLEKQIELKSIGVIGVSLGGASAIIGNVSKTANAIVLEAVYPTLQQAVQNRLSKRLGMLGRYLSPLIMLQIEPRLGFNPRLLQPISRLSKIEVPLFIIAGTDDRHTTLSESKRMYNEASEPKQFWTIKGAAHENFYWHSPDIYQEKILGFFAQYIK